MSGAGLAGRLVAVTGGARGIGIAMSRELVAQGATAVMLGRDAATLDQAVAELGQQAVGIVCDVGETASVDAAFAEIDRRFGKLDALVNNAAIGWPHRIAEVADDELHREVATNLVGPIKTVRAAVPLLRRSETPHVVNVSSDSIHDPFPYLILYAATKTALETLTRGLHQELAPEGIRVTLLRVGQTEGGGFRLGWPAERRAEAEQAWLELGYKARVSGGMVGQPASVVADALTFVLTHPVGSVVSDIDVRTQPKAGHAD